MWIGSEPPRAVDRPMFVQDWSTLAWLHYPYEPDVIMPHVPPQLTLDLANDAAWVSIVTFRIPRMRASFLPPLPVLGSATESHVRTYVIDGQGRRGVWMLSLDIDPMPASLIGRAFALPYWWASADVRRGTRSASYAVDRWIPDGGRLALDLDLRAHVDPRDQSGLDRFLTSRWVLYSGVGPLMAAIFTEHPPWQLRRASVRHLEQTYLSRLGLPEPVDEPFAHFSDGTPAVLSWPHLMIGGDPDASPEDGGGERRVGDRVPDRRERQEELVDEGIDESFPASDPPAYVSRET
ncbi:MAG TPA: DUF2071 domain-containing protein [Actinomycetota bacterium]|nr:DUF2071 domain-containing protein [Actinomycetota bacterium]